MLPFHIKLKYAWNSLKVSPVRLAIVLVLSTLALGMTGTAIAAGYRSPATVQAALLQAVEESKVDIDFDMVQYLIEEIEKYIRIFAIGGVALTVFSMLMLFQFVSLSIESHKLEIAILRALGARKRDVAEIYLTECTIISVVQWGLASAFAAGVSYFVNYSVLFMYQLQGIDFALVEFIPPLALLLLGVSLLVSLLAAGIPIYRTAKKSPVDAIRENSE